MSRILLAILNSLANKQRNPRNDIIEMVEKNGVWVRVKMKI